MERLGVNCNWYVAWLGRAGWGRMVGQGRMGWSWVVKRAGEGTA